MLDDNTKLKLGDHEIKDGGHTHAYAVLSNMSPRRREQIFHHAHHSDDGGLFSAHENGKEVEYRLSQHGTIHKV